MPDLGAGNCLRELAFMTVILLLSPWRAWKSSVGRLSDTVARLSQESCSLGRTSVQRPPKGGSPRLLPPRPPFPFLLRPATALLGQNTGCLPPLLPAGIDYHSGHDFVVLQGPLPCEVRREPNEAVERPSAQVVKSFACPNSVREHWWGWPLGCFYHFCVWRNWVIV